MATKRAGDLKAGDSYIWYHHEDVEDTRANTQFTHTLTEDAEIRRNRITGIPEAIVTGTISDPQVIHGAEALGEGELPPQVAAALAKGSGAMIYGPHLEVSLAD